MREVKPTQKPVPSSDIKDLFFNSGLLDIWATSLEHKYIDRFGSCHLTAAGMEWLFKELVEKFKVDMNTAIVAAGYITIDSFQQGADLPNNELTQRNHILRDETTGEYYRWDSDLPKPVPAGSTPQSTGGIGKGAWVSVGDASFRSDFNEISQSIQLSYESVSNMKESVPTRGIKSARVGDLVSCTTFHEDYVLPSPNIYVVTTETANGFDIIDIGNGLSAKLTNLSEGYLIERLGAKPDLHINGVIKPNPTDNYPIFDYAIKKGVSFILSGSYFSSQTLDFTNENTNKKFSVKGIIDKNFDGWGSVIGFNHDGDGVKFFAGSDASDFMVYKFGENEKTGIGVVSENTHLGEISKITVRGFSQGFDSFSWMSLFKLCTAFKCKDGFRLRTDSTSSTHINCYARECDVSGFYFDKASYTPLIGCGVDNTPRPYVFNKADGVSLIGCGAEFNDGKTYPAFIWVTGKDYVNVSIVGGKWLANGGSSAAHFIYSTFEGNNVAEVSISGMGSKTVFGLTSAFLNALADVRISDDSFLLEVPVLNAATGGGSLTYRGFTVGVSRGVMGLPNSISGKMSRVRRVIDFNSIGSNEVFIEVPAQNTGSVTHGMIRITPVSGLNTVGKINSYAELTFGTLGNYNKYYKNGVYTALNVKSANNTLGNNNQSFIIDKAQFEGNVIIDVEIEGVTDNPNGGMVSIQIAPKQWP
ncbi:hypothetical protein [Providencia rettgeri]|uniref:tail fiber/spike domain-containing protein n=1 Tax=Providencia rettgeri TaxID=587 RepID=UPI0018E40234|nr:hypothetical protein [Providencia rettgeri]MBI6193377.1 hypothetical protein [Providencia rettgeri]